MKNKKKWTIIIILLLLSTIISYLILDIKLEKDSTRYKYRYEVNIDSEENFNYTLYLPIMIKVGDGKVSPIMEKIKSEDNINTSIINTKYGKALKIKSSGTIHVLAKGKETFRDALLNMVVNETNHEAEYAVYFNSTVKNSSINISVYAISESSDDNGDYVSAINNQTVTIGWNFVKGDRGIEK